MLVAVVYLGSVGGDTTQLAAFFALVATGVWALIGLAYFVANSGTASSHLVTIYWQRNHAEDPEVEDSVEPDETEFLGILVLVLATLWYYSVLL